MPIVQALMDKLKAQYGDKEGERVYYAMEASGKGPFAAGAKHRDLHEAFVAKHNLPAEVSAPKKKTTMRSSHRQAPATAKRGRRKTGGRGR